jgi:hypothetical protein
MTSAHAHAHAHPLPGGQRFEHVHAESPDHRAEHVTLSLREAHPELADVTLAPEPGSPADYRRAAAELREQAVRFRDKAARCERTAEQLEAQADRDEQEPPDTGERFRRLFE